ncbi:peptidylprolyl isomerase fpr4 [Maudiozyma exigua]|uniref:FK506-binding protein n=1 Tax=Maudiozyma exigua TaxID=34358 RepID=A0A9P6W3W3_MAUEX|nr:peptidylprolyl isomerase fpr4 [Kazachstania exigua]
MSDMLPLATYSINVEPYDPTPAIGLDMPVTIRLTMAAIDPEPFDDEKKPSTLRMIKRNPDYDMYDYDDEDEEDIDAEESEEEEEKPKGKKHSHSHKHDHKHKKEDGEAEDEEEEEEEEIDDEFEECVLATLSPETGFQTALDITIAPEEDIQFVVTGSYTVSLSGNYVKHPFDTPIEGLGSDEDEEGEYDDEDNLDDLINDEDEEIEDLDDEQLSDELDDLEDASDIEGRIEELVAKDEKSTKQTKKNNKRKEQEPEEKEESEEEEKPAKKAKKSKKVEFKKDLEEGPTKAKQPKAKTLAGGIVVEDRVTGKGQLAKKGSRIGMRYIGKLKNGKVFDKNTSGKPFAFKLGQGEVIKGWDIGVAGMAVGGERRIVIPAPYAYGKQALPGIPANSELTFDVKLVSMK